MLVRNFPVLAAVAVARGAAAGFDYSQFVNPFIGSEGPIKGLEYGGGDIFVGGALPFGVAKVGIDTYETNRALSVLNGGYTPKGKVTAISMMHESGTGGFPKYGIIPQMPLTTIDAPFNALDNTTYWQDRVSEEAKVGYYKAKLENGVTVELSAGRHSGFMQYSFPAGSKYVLVDISHYLPSETGGYSSQVFLGGTMKVSANKKSYYGSATFGAGWNEGAPMTVYYCGEFEVPPDQAKTFIGRNTDPMIRYHTFSNGGVPQATFSTQSQQSGPLNDRIGALFTWNDGGSDQIRSRVGISFISIQKACRFAREEIPTWSLDDTVQAAVKEWNEDVLSNIRVDTESSNKTNVILLYSSMYFMHLMPSDRTGENPLWDSPEPYWDDFYTLWDIFRCTVSLYHLIQPTRYEGMIRSLIDIWKYEGFMPDGRSGNYNGLVQGGSNADNVLADAYVKGLRGDINWTAGYAAMVKDAEVTPYNTFSPDDMTGSVKEGRGALPDWLELGYISTDHFARPVSRSVEYSLNDFSLSQVAKGEAPGDVQKYLKRSAGWQRTWNHDVKSVSFKGFLTPRFSNGSWDSAGYNPAKCGECEWTAVSYEATPWEYSFVIPHDLKTLIKFMGGGSEFERRLDYAFKANTSQQNLGQNGAGITTINNPGNEPDFFTPYLFNYINKSWKSVLHSRHIANKFFHNANYGIPGNSDAGAINSWLLWQMLGLYPVVTQPVYLLSSPWFKDINMTVNHDKTLRITSKGLSENSYYVQGVKINGKSWKKNWFEHEDVMVKGGTIEFQVGSKPTVWETGAVPPSPGHF